MKKRQNIGSVVKDGLCTGCGTCVGICPNSAVEMVIDHRKGIYLPRLNEERCNNCGICYQVCPGHSVDFKQLNLEIFGKESEDILIGNYLNCYVGHSTDYDIRYNSTSGGLVTQLLLFALEEGLIDGALVTRMKKNSPLEPEPFIARTREKIIEASKSKYCPVPANIALKEILESKDGERFAIVGLPCHIHGIKKAEQINKKLRGKIVLHLGIFCSHAPNFWSTQLLLKRQKIKGNEVIGLDYRGEGWPGCMKVSRKSGELLLLLPDYWSFVGSDFFTPARCLMCCDQTSELADISFGDAWLPKLVSDKVGKSIIISRTTIGEQFLQKVRNKNLVELDHVTATEVKRSQLVMLYFKKKVLKARLWLFRRKPFLNTRLLELDWPDYLLSLFPYFNHRFSQNRILRPLLGYIPGKLLTLYRMPFNVLYSRMFQGFRSKLLEPVPKSKPIKIVITNYGSKFNKGDVALLNSRVSILRELIPDARFTILTYNPEIENDLQDIKVLEVAGIVSLSRKTLLTKKTWQTALLLLKCGLWSILHRYFHADVRSLRNGEGLNAYYNADIIISTGGDVLTEDYGTVSFLNYVVNLLFPILLSKPVMLYAESTGLFKRWWNRQIAMFLFNRIKLITLREEISFRYLKELNINTPVYLTVDSAFLLEPAPVQVARDILGREGINENNKPLIGISVSRIISRYGFDSIDSPSEKYRKYVEIMARVAEHLIDTFGAMVVFIPHVAGQWRNDDRAVADDISNLVENKQTVVSIKNEYTAEETKAIIGQCDLFIGARMHATIASTSMGVPTMAIAYSHKYHGIIGEMLGYERYVLDVRENFNSDDLIRAVDDIWNNREEIRKELESKMEDIKQRALLNAKLVKELIDCERGE